MELSIVDNNAVFFLNIIIEFVVAFKNDIVGNWKLIETCADINNESYFGVINLIAKKLHISPN